MVVFIGRSGHGADSDGVEDGGGSGGPGHRAGRRGGVPGGPAARPSQRAGGRHDRGWADSQPHAGGRATHRRQRGPVHCAEADRRHAARSGGPRHRSPDLGAGGRHHQGPRLGRDRQCPRCRPVDDRDHRDRGRPERALADPPAGARVRRAGVEDRRCWRPASRCSTCSPRT